MADTEELKRFIQKLHLRTFNKIYPHVKEKYPDATAEQVKDIIKSFVKDPKHLDQRKFYNKIFSDHLHAWMCDLLDNSGQTPDYTSKAYKELHETTKETPLYFIIFININTRFAVAYPLYHKTNETILDKIKQFLSIHKCSSLTSDKESAFVSSEISNYLKSKNVSQYIVLDGNHTSLAIMDSFIRHLRDMNITNEKSKYQSHHSKYRNFSTHRMARLIDIYNNTVHSSTNMKPVDMENDEKAERQYIAFNLIRRSKMKNHEIPEGHYVRVVLDKKLMKKMRFKVSREVYKIAGRDGKNYFVAAADNTMRTLPRHRLIDIDESMGKYKFAETIPEGFRIPTSIITKEKRDKRYLVSFGDEGNGYMRKVDIRRHHPQVETPIEKEFKAKSTIKINLPKPMIRINLNN